MCMRGGGGGGVGSVCGGLFEVLKGRSVKGKV
jgi:hypothetical protein